MTLSFWSFSLLLTWLFSVVVNICSNSVFQLLNVTNDISHVNYHVIITSMYILKFIFILLRIKSVQILNFRILRLAIPRVNAGHKTGKSQKSVIGYWIFNLFWGLNESSSIFSDLRLLCKLLDCFDFRIRNPNLLYHQLPMSLDEDMTRDPQNHLKFVNQDISGPALPDRISVSEMD